jgi:hypothetical protein
VIQLAVESQKVAEKQADTKRLQATILARTKLEVSVIEYRQQVAEQEVKYVTCYTMLHNVYNFEFLCVSIIVLFYIYIYPRFVHIQMMYLFIYLSIHLSIYLSIHLSIFLSIYLTI